MSVHPGQAVFTPAGSYIQLVNDGEDVVETLYVVSPAYVYLPEGAGGEPYDDSLVLDEGWDALAANGWRASKPVPPPAARDRARAVVRGES